MQTFDNIDSLLKRARARGYVIVAPPSKRRRQRTDPHSKAVVACCQRFRLSFAEGQAFATLLRGGPVSKQELHAVVSSNPTITDVKLVGVVICKLRRKLRAHGIEITTVWKIGFLLNPSNRAKAQKLLAEQAAALAQE